MKPAGCDQTPALLATFPRLIPEPAPSSFQDDIHRHTEDFLRANPYFFPDGSRSDKVLCSPEALRTLLTTIEQLVWSEAERMAAHCVTERTTTAAPMLPEDPRRLWLECKASEAQRLQDYFHRKQTHSPTLPPCSPPPATGTGAL